MSLFDYFKNTLNNFYQQYNNDDIKIDYNKLSKIKNDVKLEKKNIEINQKVLVKTDCLNLINAFEQIINVEIEKNINRLVDNVDNKNVLLLCANKINKNSNANFSDKTLMLKYCSIDLDLIGEKLEKNTKFKVNLYVDDDGNFIEPYLCIKK